MSKLEKMPKEELINVLSILLKYDPQLKDYDIEFGPEAVNIRLNGHHAEALPSETFTMRMKEWGMSHRLQIL